MQSKKISGENVVLKRIGLNAAGVNTGPEKNYVATRTGTVQKYSNFTQGIKESLAYIKPQGADSEIMENLILPA